MSHLGEDRPSNLVSKDMYGNMVRQRDYALEKLEAQEAETVRLREELTQLKHFAPENPAGVKPYWQQRAEKAEGVVADYEHRISWDTTCGNCANLMDKLYDADQVQNGALKEALIELLKVKDGPRDEIKPTAWEDARQLLRRLT